MAMRSSKPAAPIGKKSDKLFFAMREAVEAVGVPAYTLRYWEKEFSSIRPQRSSSAHRRYRRRDIELFLRIKSLIQDEKHTLEGAKQLLAKELRAEKLKSGQIGLEEAVQNLEAKSREEALFLAKELVKQIIELVGP